MTRKLNQVGDTIVEVLIAVAIAGLMLTGAFAIANVSYKQIRMAQERSEAQRIAQASVELLGSAAALRGLDKGSRPAAFCIKDDLSTPVASDTAACTQGDRYKVSIERRGDSGVDISTFSVKVTWDGLSGRVEQLIIDYRVGVTT